MKNLVEKIKVAVFSRDEGEKEVREQFDFEFIKVRKSVLVELNASRETGSLIGIVCPGIGDGMFITAIEDIYGEGKEQIVVLKPYEMSGHIFSRRHISLSEIRSVCPFKAFYQEPV